MSMLDREYPHQVHLEKDQYHLIKEMSTWCLANIGEGGYIVGNNGEVWALVTAFGKSSWLFKKEEDATLFALKWV